jgi:hypothetical protein
MLLPFIVFVVFICYQGLSFCPHKIPLSISILSQTDPLKFKQSHAPGSCYDSATKMASM